MAGIRNKKTVADREDGGYRVFSASAALAVCTPLTASSTAGQ
jgi:hypothetical protein